jgi:hypothetical protein
MMPAFAPQAQSLMNQSLLADPFAAAGIKSLAWGKLPAAAAGKAIKSAALTLTVKGSNGKAIKGTYPTPITLTNTDKTGATKLFVNGKAASKKNTVKKSTDKITLKYSGLAIVQATFQAAAKGVKKPAKTTFKPTPSKITYSGPNPTAPEIDLTSTTPATTGYSGAFTASQLGWSNSPFNKKFTYALSAVPSFANNCATAFTISPASGGGGGPFTVSGKAGAAAGECSMTITGGAGATLRVLLTFTTTSVGVNGKQAPN